MEATLLDFSIATGALAAGTLSVAYDRPVQAAALVASAMALYAATGAAECAR